MPTDAIRYMPLEIARYEGDTTHLTLAQHGAYLRLLMFIYRDPSHSLPDDDLQLARILGVNVATWRKLAPEVRAFFTRSLDGRLVQKRAEKETARAKDKIAHNRTAAKSRWVKAELKQSPLSTARKPAVNIGGQPAVISRCIAADRGQVIEKPQTTPCERITRDSNRLDLRSLKISVTRTAGPGQPDPTRPKNQARADVDMATFLQIAQRLDPGEAWQLVQIGRDPAHPEHRKVADELEGYSRARRLGWFARDRLNVSRETFSIISEEEGGDTMPLESVPE